MAQQEGLFGSVGTAHQELTQFWFREFEARFNQRPIWGAKQGALLKKLLRQFDEGEIQTRMLALLDSTDPWYRQHRDIPELVRSWNSLEAPKASTKMERAQRLGQEWLTHALNKRRLTHS